MLSLIVGLLVACSSDDSATSTINNDADAAATAPTAEVNNTTSNSPSASTENTETQSTTLAATVNGTPITIADLEAAVTARSTVVDETVSTATLREVVLNDLIDQVLIEQYAVANDIRVTEADIQNEINTLQTQLEASGGTLTALLGLPADTDEALITQQIEDVLLTTAVEAYVFENATLDSTQVRARHIVVATEAEANMLLEQLQAGEDFASLAASFSQDSSTADAGGDLGWVARGELLEASVERIIFTLPVDSRYPVPVQSSLGWHIIEVLNRDDSAALTQTQVLRQRQQIFQNWLAEQRTNASIERFIS